IVQEVETPEQISDAPSAEINIDETQNENMETAAETYTGTSIDPVNPEETYNEKLEDEVVTIESTKEIIDGIREEFRLPEEEVLESEIGNQSKSNVPDEEIPTGTAPIEEEVIDEFPDIEDDILNETIKIQDETFSEIPDTEEPIEQSVEIHESGFHSYHSDYDDIAPVENNIESAEDSLQSQWNESNELQIINESDSRNEVEVNDEIQPEYYYEITDEKNIEKETVNSAELEDIYSDNLTQAETVEKINEISQELHAEADANTEEPVDENSREIPDEAPAFISERKQSITQAIENYGDVAIETIEIYGETPYEIDEYKQDEFSVETIEVAPGSLIETHNKIQNEVSSAELHNNVEKIAEFAEVLGDELSHQLIPESSPIEDGIAVPTIEDNIIAPIVETQVTNPVENIPVIQEELSAIEHTLQEVPKQTVPSVLSFIDKKQHDEFVKKLCAKDEEVFTKLTTDIDNCSAWKEAAQTIDKFFLRHKIDHRSAAAISFRTIVQKRYSGT
ncbi:MAG: hypothetical protein HYZ54_05185, partial [Ignavibacteriae bacterium]|nr:hypothetical protein [Ignavibacteriota bacterium]